MNATEPFYRVFNISYGGTYDISMSSNFAGPYSEVVTYFAPPINPPIETEVKLYPNGSYLVNWTEANLTTMADRVLYDILVQEGNTLNETTAVVFTVDKPPFIYTNSSATTYTFAVRVRTGKGLISKPSPWISKYSQPISHSSVNTTAIVVPCILVFIALSAVIVFLVIRNRKLHGNFTRFANSHYDTRSEAATFEDNGLEEEEHPQIRGFADDEPLVIA